MSLNIFSINIQSCLPCQDGKNVDIFVMWEGVSIPKISFDKDGIVNVCFMFRQLLLSMLWTNRAV